MWKTKLTFFIIGLLLIFVVGVSYINETPEGMLAFALTICAIALLGRMYSRASLVFALPGLYLYGMYLFEQSYGNIHQSIGIGFMVFFLIVISDLIALLPNAKESKKDE